MSIKDILEANGLSGESLDNAMEAINKEIPKNFVSKKQYEKKTNLIEELNGKVADLEVKASQGPSDEFKSKYETLTQEFEDFKNNIEVEKTNSTKTSEIKKLLSEAGLKNEKITNLLMKEINLEEVTLNNGTVDGWNDLLEGIKGNYGEFFSTTQTVGGANPATPPMSNAGKTYTLDSIKNMTAEQVKANYAQIRQDLAVK